MTEDKYKILCETSDSFLQHPETSIPGLAIPWLHILNEHPSNLIKYQDSFLLSLRRQFGSIKSALRTMIDFLTTRRSPLGWELSHDLESHIDVLMVSHLLNKMHIGVKNDFYFGSLPEELSRCGLSLLVVLHNHTGTKSLKIRGHWPEDQPPRLLFDQVLSFKDEWDLRRKLKQQSKRLRALSKETQTEEERNVLEMASFEALSTDSIVSLRFYLQLCRLVERYKPKVIVVTYEGHAWERLAFAASRTAVKKVLCVGYQHAILFPKQHAIMRTLRYDCNPDIIWTSGDITRNALAEVVDSKTTRIETVGTPKFSQPNTDLIQKFTADGKICCLVIPDGTVSECLLIINFVLASAKLAPNVDFLIRMHPVIEFSYLVKLNPQLKNLPSNVILSNNSLQIDISNSRWALYRGSSVVIQSIVAGLRPFYVSTNTELCIDPIYALKSWRKHTSCPADFTRMIENDLKADEVNLVEEWSHARDFCLKYFCEFNVTKIIETIGGRDGIGLANS